VSDGFALRGRKAVEPSSVSSVDREEAISLIANRAIEAAIEGTIYVFRSVLADQDDCRSVAGQLAVGKCLSPP